MTTLPILRKEFNLLCARLTLATVDPQYPYLITPLLVIAESAHPMPKPPYTTEGPFTVNRRPRQWVEILIAAACGFFIGLLAKGNL